MRIYAAAPDRVPGPFHETNYPWLLVSFGLKGSFDGLRSLPYRPRSVLIDSGAFSAWSIGTTIRLDDYRKAIEQLRARPLADEQWFINLDVIPGVRGQDPTAEQRASAVEEGMRNADVLRGDGIPIVEVHHQYESRDVLLELAARRKPGDLLGLSARNDQPTPVRRRFLDAAFHTLLASYPHDAIPPCHGFGLSTDTLVRRYPWATCDSTSWVVPRRYGERITKVDGRRTRFTPRGQMLTDRKPISALAMLEILARWRSIETEMTEAWVRRGVVLAA